MYIFSVCIKVKRFRYKYVWFLDYQRAGVSLSAILVLLQSVVCQLFWICTVSWICLYFDFCWGVSLDIPYLGMKSGHLFHNLNQLL